MKKLFFIATIFTTIFSANAADLAKDMFSGTEFKFNQRIDLSEGQQSLLVASRECKFRFKNAAIGKKHIEAGETLVVSKVKVSNERESFNPSTGAPIRVLPSIEIRFKGIQSRITCRGEDTHNITIQNFESDSIFKVTPPQESKRFIID